MDTRGMIALAARPCANTMDGEREEACAAVDKAMQSLGLALETVLNAMASLDAARAALNRAGDVARRSQTAPN
ncbi:hypothetical protein WL48_18665 [Burkholderia ubonensis]|nr:hypothetical protein WL48_18665 [Burkholderia ubonensis]